MQRIYDRIDARFRRTGAWIASRAWLVLALSALFTAALASGLPWLGFDTSIDGFLEPHDPMRVRYDEFREQFGRDEMILVALRPKQLFDIQFLQLLKRLHRELEDELPRLNEVTSLVNARNTRGEGDVLVVDDLLLRVPETPEELETFRHQALTDPIYRDLWISDDGTIANLAIETDAFDLAQPARTDTSQEAFDAEAFEAAPRPVVVHKPLRSETNAEIVAAVHRIVDRYRSPDLEIWISGSPTMTARLLLAMERDMGQLLLGSMLTIGVLLAVVFRRAAGVVLPLVVVGLSIVSMLGSMAFMGIDMAFGTQILPSAILAIGVGYAVHLLTSFFAHYDATGDRVEAISHTFASVGVAITMSALTTAIGFGSFATSSVSPLYRMGCVAPLGATLAFLYTIVVLPALLAVVPLRRRAAATDDGDTWIERCLVAIGDFAQRRARGVSIGAACVAVVAVVLASRLEFSHNPMMWLPAGDPVRTSHDFLDEALDGTVVMEVILDFGRENALHDPEILRKIETLASHARAQSAEQVAVHKTLSIARMTLKVGWVDATHYPLFIASLERYARGLFGPAVSLHTTGMLPMMSRTMTSLMTSAASSYLSAFLSIVPFMILLIGRLRPALASVIPTLFPLLVTTGAMSALGFKLDMFTILVGSIALGLAVDDTTHFVHAFARWHDRTGDVPTALRETMRTTGRAMLFTTLVLVSGFLVFTLSELNNLIRFGAFTATALATAFVADIVVAPALLALTASRADRLHRSPEARRTGERSARARLSPGLSPGRVAQPARVRPDSRGTHS